MERDTAVNQDQAELTFAAKIDYLQPAGAYNTTLQFNIVANPLVTYIQNLNPSLCTEEPLTVVDKRDGQEYVVQRLKDGNCWMMNNMNLGATDITTDLTSDNTNLSTSINATTFNSWRKTSGLGVNTSPWYVPITAANSADHRDTDPNNGVSYGILYNYCATTAGTICTTTTSSPTYDLCPAGWRLPIGGTSSEYRRLYDLPEYNSVAKVIAPVSSGGLAYTRSGYLINAPENQGAYGYNWTSTPQSTSRIYILSYDPAGNTIELADSTRWTWSNLPYGLTFRCVMKDARTISEITTMQDINAQIVANTAEGSTATLKDVRDNQGYTIAKINGNVWMTRNLAIGCNGTGSTYGSTITPIELTPANTNITSNWTTPTDSLAVIGNTLTDPAMMCSSTYGAWYNYVAATAGTITGASNSTNAIVDICPAGWRLATYTEQSGITSSVSLFSPVAGGYYYAKNNDVISGGWYWASTANGATGRYRLVWDGSTLVANSANYREDGFYVRCIAK